MVTVGAAGVVTTGGTAREAPDGCPDAANAISGAIIHTENKVVCLASMEKSKLTGSRFGPASIRALLCAAEIS